MTTNWTMKIKDQQTLEARIPTTMRIPYMERKAAAITSVHRSRDRYVTF